MKKPLFFIMALLSLSIATAQDFIVDDIAYNIIPGTTTVEVARKPGCYSGAITIPEIVIYNTINYNVTAIGSSAFGGCNSLTSIDLPNSITSIGRYAFAASGLRTISLPNSITSIGRSAFGSNKSLTSIKLPNSLTTIEDRTFAACTSLTSLNLPNSLISIGYQAFFDCRGLTSVNLGNSVTSIGDQAFGRSLILNSIDIPDSVTSIGKEAFYLCIELSTVSIGNSVTSIGDAAFRRCTNLSTVTIDLATPIAINESVFNSVTLSSVALNVPIGSEAAYRASNIWQNFNPINGILLKSVKNDIAIYSNPAQNTMHIKHDASVNIESIDVLNFEGNIVKTSTESTIDVSDLSKGIYILKLNTSQGVISKKVVKN